MFISKFKFYFSWYSPFHSNYILWVFSQYFSTNSHHKICADKFVFQQCMTAFIILWFNKIFLRFFFYFFFLAHIFYTALFQLHYLHLWVLLLIQLSILFFFLTFCINNISSVLLRLRRRSGTSLNACGWRLFNCWCCCWYLLLLLLLFQHI